MSVLLPIVMFALAGILGGGAWSLHRQGAARGTVALTVLLGLLAFAGGVMWLLPVGGTGG